MIAFMTSPFRRNLAAYCRYTKNDVSFIIFSDNENKAA
jgi:hypothetical protein